MEHLGNSFEQLIFADLAICLHMLKMDNDLTNVIADYQRFYSFFSLVVMTTSSDLWADTSLCPTVIPEDQEAFCRLTNRPPNSLEEWFVACNLQLTRNNISHPFTIGK